MGKRSSKRPYAKGHRELDMDRLASVPRRFDKPDGSSYSMSRVSGSAKTYTCPGCLCPIVPKTAHVVAWYEQAPFGRDIGVESRRHWHSRCWERQLRPC